MSSTKAVPHSTPAPANKPLFTLIRIHTRAQVLEQLRIPVAVLSSTVFPTLALVFFVLPQTAVTSNPQASLMSIAQLAVFGVYMGASFAPNHKGMPIIPKDSKVDFLSRQVLTSRNIKGTGMNTLMGGLNYQIEHHLFPNMPRPNLARASEIVKAYCAEHKIPYTETTLTQSYGIVVRYLNEVGLSARDPFDCPMTAQRRR